MAKTQTLRSMDQRMNSVRWDDDSPLSMTIQTDRGTVTSRHGRFVGGRADGVEIIELSTVTLNSGTLVVRVLPTRGMGLWNLELDGTLFGWSSPVDGPVHPALVPLHDSTGIGWLEGFDELFVRCGLESNGAPEFNENGQLTYPLHGRIANLPADGLQIEYDEVTGRVELVGQLRESRLFFSNFTVRSRIRIHSGNSTVEVLDDVTNESASTQTMQMLYHINVGAPVLDDGSSVVLPIEDLAPKDSLSASEIDHWDHYGAPETGYRERVYFAKLRADDANLTSVMLQNAAHDKALGVTYSSKTLPRFVVWKNTAALADGYVTGLEPATNYPNTRSFESSQGRVVELKPEQTISFRVNLSPMVDEKSVDDMQSRIAKIAGDHPPTIHKVPRPGWTPGA